MKIEPIKIFCKILGIVSAAAGLLLCVHVYHMYDLSNQAMKWPVTKGQILFIRSYSDTSSSTKHNPSAWPICKVLQYNYKVSGQIYTNDTALIGDRKCINTGSAYTQHLDHYKAGDMIDVHYEPDNPAISTLVAGHMDDGVELVYVFGLFIFAVLFWNTKADNKVKPTS